MQFRNITTFLLGTFFLYGLLTFLTFWLDVEQYGILGIILSQLAFLWAPGLAALYVHKIQNGKSLEELGLVRKYMDRKWFWAAIALPYAAVAGTLGLIYVMGNILHIPGFGEVIIGNAPSYFPSIGSTYDWLAVPGPMGTEEILGFSLSLPPMIVNAILLFLVLGFVIGPNISMVLLLGEEIGWRGLMVKETQHKGYLKSNMIIGACWAATYLPFMLMANDGAYVYLEFIVLLAFCISFTFPLTYLNFKANSILPSAALRGTFGIVAAVCVFLVMGGSELIGSITGIAGTMFFALVSLIIYRFDREFVSSYPKLRFERKWKEGEAPEEETENNPHNEETE